VRAANGFRFNAIAEVACLFVGIFVCMQVPMEILKERGGELGLSRPWEFFWATGLLSSFLDNAPTYAVFFETAGVFGVEHGPVLHGVQAVDGTIPLALLRAVSLGAVLMGANTYIGNGPNFMVKSIAEEAGVKMPSFFAYLAYTTLVLVPLFVVLTLVFLRG
jgi:Na+/H+ antiporter NhaD/arsenite permease-like protein